MAEKEMTFEAAMARLEEIVRALEGGSAGLDASLGLFEEGISLVKLCNAKRARNRRSSCLPQAATVRLLKPILTGAANDADLA